MTYLEVELIAITLSAFIFIIRLKLLEVYVFNQVKLIIEDKE